MKKKKSPQVNHAGGGGYITFLHDIAQNNWVKQWNLTSESGVSVVNSASCPHCSIGTSYYGDILSSRHNWSLMMLTSSVLYMPIPQPPAGKSYTSHSLPVLPSAGVKMILNFPGWSTTKSVALYCIKTQQLPLTPRSHWGRLIKGG